MKLTKTRVEALPTPSTGQAFYWDWEDVPNGFGVRVTISGTRSYILQKRVDGKSKRITLGVHGDITCNEAKLRASEEMLLFSRGTTSTIEKKRVKKLSVTLREVTIDYCANRRTKKGGKLTAMTIRDITRHLNSNFGDWADKPIVNITSEMCRDRFKEISIRSPAQANQAFRILRALINYSIDEENPRFNPVQTLSKKGLWNPNNSKSGSIPLEKIGIVWNMLQERRRSPAMLPVAQTGADITLFILLTGCRWSEAAELTWDCVESDSWHVADPKNHNPVSFPIYPILRALLDARPRIEGNPYVFPGRRKADFLKDARAAMDEVSKLAGRHLTHHDLRRTFIAIGIKLRIEMWKLKLLTNHVSKGDVTIDHYTETNDLRYLADEAGQIAGWIAGQGAKEYQQL